MTLPKAKRRLSAILVADVVGYSRLVEADESGTLAAIKELRDTLLRPCWPSTTVASSSLWATA
jgi:class 3 adenylate cyclase